MLTYVVVFVLLCISIYMLYQYYSNLIKLKSEFVENNEYKEVIVTNKGDIYIFYAAWCPHSTKALAKLKEIEQTYIGSKFVLTFTEIDAEKDSEMADSYNIESYPTIVLVYKNEKYMYDAELNEQTFDKFLNTIMN